MLPVTPKLVKVPTLVMLGCAAVVNGPVIAVNTPVAAPILPTLALPNTDSMPDVLKLPAEKFPDKAIPPVTLRLLVILALPTTVMSPKLAIFPAVKLPTIFA